MLLCDHILFWFEHRQSPEIRSDADLIRFLVAVELSIIRIRFVQQLICAAVVKLADDMAVVYEAEGRAGVLRWIAERTTKL